MNFKSTARAAIFLALVACVSSPVFAQATGGAAPAPAPAAQAAKIGILDVRQAIVLTAEGKLAQAELQSQFASRQAELENLNKQVEDIRKRLQAIERTGSDEEKNRLTREGQRLTSQIQRKSDDLREDLQAAEGEVIERIGGKMREVLDRYSRENGFTIVFDVSSQAGNIIYAATGINITQDIIRLFDQAHPVRGAAAPPPAQPRPQPGTPAQKPPQKPPQQ
jgi:outer membrane protein